MGCYYSPGGEALGVPLCLLGLQGRWGVPRGTRSHLLSGLPPSVTVLPPVRGGARQDWDSTVPDSNGGLEHDGLKHGK